MLSVPSSGLVPVQLLPRFFQGLHAIMPLGNATRMTPAERAELGAWIRAVAGMK